MEVLRHFTSADHACVWLTSYYAAQYTSYHITTARDSNTERHSLPHQRILERILVLHAHMHRLILLTQWKLRGNVILQRHARLRRALL